LLPGEALLPSASLKGSTLRNCKPVSLGGRRVFLMGVREQPGEDFNYLRIPADAKGGKEAWLRLRADLARPELREWAARRYAAQATPKEQPGMMPELYVTSKRALSLFSGADAAKAQEAQAEGKPRMAPGGLPALSQFVDSEVPAAERRNAAEALLRILNGSVFELYKLGLEQRHQPVPEASAALQDFMTQAVLALSDSMLYPADFLLELEDFSQVQAGVFQLTRAPGQPLIALGLALLVTGVLLMRYLRLRRLWIWLEPAPGQPGCTRARLAMASTQVSAATVAEFEGIRQALLKDSA
jgi:cytochrome c biogenesis protein